MRAHETVCFEMFAREIEHRLFEPNDIGHQSRGVAALSDDGEDGLDGWQWHTDHDEVTWDDIGNFVGDFTEDTRSAGFIEGRLVVVYTNECERWGTLIQRFGERPANESEAYDTNALHDSNHTHRSSLVRATTLLTVRP